MTVDSGMDVDRIRTIAQQLIGLGDRIETVAQTGRGQMSVLTQAWEGQDLEQFSRSWTAGERQLHSAGDRTKEFGSVLMKQADQQEDASGSSGGGGSTGPGGPGGRGDGGFGLDDLSALGVLGKGLKELVTGGLRLHAALTNNVFKMYNGILPSGRLMQVLGVTADQLADLRAGTLLGKFSPRLANLMGTVGPHLGKVLGPLGVLGGGWDVYAGLRDGDYLRSVGGGLSMISGGLATAAAFGVALTPVGIAVMAGAGIAAAGIAVYQNWDAISGAFSDAGGWIADRAGDVASGVRNAASAVGDGLRNAADSVGSVLSDPIGSIGGLFS